jgi:hypothetical protein
MIKKVIAGLVVIILLTGLIGMGKFWEINDTDSILVVQAPFSGEISTYFDAGTKWQGWGKVTHYKKSSLLNFNAKDGAIPIKVRFADGGHGDVSGSCRFDLPLKKQEMIDIHQTFGSQVAVEKQLVRTTTERSMYMTGPLMTSAESFNVRRPDLINLFEDQAKHGVFQTVQSSREVDDPVTGQKKWLAVVDMRKDEHGNVLRQEESPLVRFGVNMYNIAIVDINYEKVVEDQISQQQQATIAVQIAIANTKRAEQDNLTFAKQGEAEATKAKWAQEVIKATAVTRAEQEKMVATTQANQRLQVASLDKQAAEQTKQQQILLGEGESTRAKLVMQANGALEQKLQTYLKVAEVNAVAIGSYRGALVPSVIMGAGANNSGASGSVVDLISMLNARAAKDLALDLGVSNNVVK